MSEQDIAKQPNDNCIDDIFEQADKEMHEQREAVQYKEKKRKHRFLKIFISSVAILAAIVFVIAYLGFNEIKKMYPEMRASFIEEYEFVQGEIFQKNDNDLTVKEYYTKQIILLIPKGELENRITEVDDLVEVKSIFTIKGENGSSILTDSEREQYNKLQKEFNDYVKNGGDPEQKYIDAVANGQIKK